MTLILTETDLDTLLDMREVVSSVEEAFRREAAGEVDNSLRTRSRAPGAVLNAMHACLHYIGRGGLKCYLSSRMGTRFVFILFDLSNGRPLAIMGADSLGKYRTGAASGVATKFLYRRTSARLAICGSGRQALAQVLGIAATVSITSVNVWSPNSEHRDAFCVKLRDKGFDSKAFASPAEALADADVASTITSTKTPFLTPDALRGLSHLNACGSNQPDRSEVSIAGVAGFGTVVVDDKCQATSEYGDLIQAAKSGGFSWEAVAELKDIVAGKAVPSGGPTLFKSGGVALEDVAVGNMIYEKALNSGRYADAAVVNLP